MTLKILRFAYCMTAIFMTSLTSCEKNTRSIYKENSPIIKNKETKVITPKISLLVLGTIQDAGSPQIGCTKDCCIDLYKHPDHKRKVSSLGLVDAINHKTYLFDATPDISTQLEMLTRHDTLNKKNTTDGIFLTHAHIGHYTGLMYLGKEAMDAQKVPVYAMPKMTEFLSQNGPWSQLVARENITLRATQHNKPIPLDSDISVTPLLVPHRDEFSETVGYKIKGPNKTALFIPDIDKWEKWEMDITQAIKDVDFAFLDATFYSGTELGNRDMKEIPHPFILESLERFAALESEDKVKIHFIHFNHTNPVIHLDSPEAKSVMSQGFNIAQIGTVFEM